jgi:nucleotide-binding universal stress UspA family protein
MAYTIIVGFDDSEASKAAIDMAVVMAKKFEGRIVVATGLAPNYAPRRAPEQEFRWEETRAACELGMREVIDGCGDACQLMEAVAVPLSPVQALVSLAEERGADLIVVGSNGEGRVKGLLLGSTAFGVIQRSPVPVLVVPPPA